MERRNEILEEYPDYEFMFADGFDEAIIGIDISSYRVVYDANIMTNILVNEGMSDFEAIEYLEHNTFFTYVGEKTPIYINRI